MVIGGAVLLATSAPAQDRLAIERERLERAKSDADAAAKRAVALDRQAAAERDAAAKARAEEAAMGERIAAAEADITAARARVAIVERLLAEQRADLGARQQPVARLLAALGSLARRPAVAAIAQPGSVDDLVHIRAVLGTALPVVRARTTDVREELDRTRALQANAALAAKSLRDGRVTLVRERRALAALQVRHAAAATRLGRDALAESDRAIGLGEAARDIVDRMETIGDDRATRAALSRLPGPPVTDPAPIGQAPTYRLPVRGRLLAGLGEVSENGVRARGLSVATEPGARVIAPAAGKIVFARAFRGFGQVVIVDHGAEWTTLVTGLGAVDVAAGQAVTAGDVLGRAGRGERAQVGVELRRHGRPVDITGLIG
ncbi:peptidoglycan DD-metalloendopeptidase family protein [Sphingomonas sp. SUN019]|uniref:murein hydrolase activator EnvC family protein n=1 Tax=Sphingomonas sp. SUN019 TaxID=2937788 RepID=UPI00216425AE|nr:peptidoglycan DD-metalloendopeptidase family protein [Sphingomonas sp. SUN019]UVO52533.1 peptidoglycan DD-metalloendopeptidase family protein [Sphingomonas sp. SUN019]